MKVLTFYNFYDNIIIKNKEMKQNEYIIFGRTPEEEVYTTINGDICIDTGCVFGNKLTAMIIINNDFYFIQEDKNEND